MSIWQCLAFAFIVMLAASIEGIVGFGGNILALPFIGLFVDIKIAVPLLMLVPLVNATLRMVVDREYKNIIWPVFWKITLYGLLGAVIGVSMAAYLSETVLKICLSLFMILVAVKGLYECKHTELQLVGKMNGWLREVVQIVLLLLSGIYNGAFACGGPFVVIYATSVLKDKKHFRATMYSTVLVTMGFIVAQHWVNGTYTGTNPYAGLLLLPALFLGFLTSSILQKRLNGEKFLQVVYGVLLAAGGIMLITSLL